MQRYGNSHGYKLMKIWVEIRERQALQAVQLVAWRILSCKTALQVLTRVASDNSQCNWDVKDESPALFGGGSKVSSSTSPDTNDEIETANKPVRVSYITEQTSHHPPVSAFWVDCPVKGVSAYGFDQLSVKFTGTSVRVMPGAHNLGIFIRLQSRDDEEYRLTHPTAYLGGLIRGNPSITVADTCYVTCPKTKTKTILQYLEESWLGKTQNRVNGIVFQYDPENDSKTRIKDVSEKDVLARIEGCWHEQVFYTLAGSKVRPLHIHFLQ